MKIWIVITCICTLWFSAEGQTNEEEPEFDCYQVYFDEAVERIVNVEYIDGKDALEYHLDPGGTRMILENYKGKKRIEYSVVTKAGEEKTFTKSSCFIDPCEITL